jgi:triacylglycerol esterase/lipase EstA (alpha/beta hydrolase family)
MLRPARLAVCSIAALLLAAMAGSPSAFAGPAEKAIPVVFVHGFYPDDCPDGLHVTSAMSGPTGELADHGWTGSLDVVAFYACDHGGTRIGNDTTDTSIRRIGAQLAQYIYRTYTAQGQAVDIVAHSIGGLAARVATKFTAAKLPGFPPSLLVNRVVTFSTPYKGVALSAIREVPGFPGTRQARQVRVGSAFLASLATHGSAAGTRWLVIGSSGGCDLVRGGSAVGVLHALRLRYTGCWSHIQYLYDATATRSYPAYRNGVRTMAYGPLKEMTRFLVRS